MKAAQSPRDFEEYVAALPPDIQALMRNIRLTIQQAAPDAEEAIRYQMPTFILEGNLLHFAAYKKHIGMYPAPREGVALQKALSAYAEAGTVRFPLDQEIPLALIGRMVKARVKENRARAAARKKARKK